MNSEPRRAIPSVDKLVAALAPTRLPRPMVVDHIRRCLSAYRTGSEGEVPAFADLVQRLNRELLTLSRSRLQAVINATGVLAHTNLGRAPLAPTALRLLQEVAHGYSNLELDLESGQRGTRGAYLEAALALLCEAEAATLVNNCAAALVLALRHFTRGPRRDVLLSRGELVQIGGGFRIPEILEASGACLREVGTTNRTTLADYREALGTNSALILKVHRSNFFMEGFVESPSTRDLAALAREQNVPFLEDLGSGALVDLQAFAGLGHEPQPQEALREGVDLVCFSGDKLLGGPQCGILAGRLDFITPLKKDPFFRALRCDKLVFAALQCTVEAYLGTPNARVPVTPQEVPILELMRLPESSLRERAISLRASLENLPLEVEIVTSAGRIGGGVCPRSSIPSVALRIRSRSMSSETLAARLRQGSPPVVPTLGDDAVHLDLRTVFPEQDRLLADALRQSISEPTPISSHLPRP